MKVRTMKGLDLFRRLFATLRIMPGSLFFIHPGISRAFAILPFSPLAKNAQTIRATHFLAHIYIYPSRGVARATRVVIVA